MKRNRLYTLAAAIILCSCSGAVNHDEITPTKPASTVEQCMEYYLPEYIAHYEQMKTDLIADGIVDDTKNAYADLYEIIFDTEYTQNQIDTAKLKEYQFLSSFGPFLQLSTCSALAKNDSVLTEKQRKYYEIYESSGKAGFFDVFAIAEIIRAMNEGEFESNGIKQSTIFYLGNEYLYNRYCIFLVPEDSSETGIVFER